MKFYEISQRFMRFAVGTVLILAAGACGSGGSGDGGTPPATPPASVTLTIAKAGVGTGTVTSNPAGINCGTTCTLTVSSGTVVTLTAAPTPNNTLTDWGGICPAGSATCAVTVTANQTVTPTFTTSSANPTLGFTLAGTGTGVITCNGGACNASYPWGTTMTVSGVASANSSFAGWSGGGCTGTADCTVLLWANTQLTATFNLVPVTAQLTVNRTGSGTGIVTSAPAGINCGTTCSANYSGGTAVTLTATSSNGSTFAGWSGGGCTGTGTCAVTLNANATVTATFNTVPPTVTFSPTTSGTGTGTVTCNGASCQPSYPSGTALTIVATPAATSLFSGWGGDCASAGSATTCNLTINADSTVSATFNLPTLAVVVAGTGSVTSDPAGINCGATCTASFNKNTSITLTAAPAAGMIFTGWSGGGCTGTTPCVLSLTQDVTATATFSIGVASCPAEATLVKDIVPSAGSAFFTSGNELVNVNGTLFFKATDGVNGFEIWKSDGTAASTMLVKDIGAGNNRASDLVPQFLTNVAGTLFFVMNDGVHGQELWKSDGTEAGTVLVKDINPGAASAFNFLLTDSLLAIEDTLFFTANDGVNGVELWKSDGTEVGTVLVKNINPNGGSFPVLLTNANGTLFFGATDGITGTELWKSDGSSAGTVLVKDIHTGGGASLNFVPNSMVNVNGTVFFAALPSSAGELWKSDGTAAGTVFVKDIAPQELVNVNGTLFIDVGNDIWKSDGTASGTVLVKALAGANELARVGGTLYFRGQTSSVGSQPYISDGTAVGTGVLKSDLFLLGNASGIPWFTDVNGTAFFAASDGVTGVELWKSNGTAAGTVLVKDIVSGGNSGPTNLTKVDRKLFFIAGATGLGRELWVVCGTP